MRTRRMAVVAVILVGSLLMVSAGCRPQQAEEAKKVIRVGVAGPMQFIQGKHHWLGAEMAAEEINGAGGVNIGGEKYTIELVKVDTNELLSVEDAANAVEKAITVDKVDFLVGTIRTEAALAMQEVAMDHKKIFLVCGAAHPELAQKVQKDYNRYKYWFRVSPVNSTYLAKASFLLLAHVGGVVRKELGIQKPKVAIVSEKASWADPLVGAAQQVIPTMGMEVAGVWRPSPTATDLTAELSAIRNSGAHIIYTSFSAAAGVPYARQWGELQIPAASVGINVEAQAKGFLQATDNKGNYECTLNALARVEITPKTIPFYDKFTERAGEFPTYNADTCQAIFIWKEAAERAGKLDADAIVAELEKTDYQAPGGRMVFDKTHDLVWGPGYVTTVGTQWQDGKLVAIWPYNWEGVTYPGTVPYQLPPWVVSHWKK
ncbi:MAG: ABC transporter substrate-binding protein [Bacillota bacterium]|nr:ABC transporter substrate-binding protein [Bacillota bacterium]MDI7249061.1 ABC transporter substrate-binding protein [Bacillota bacterium]